MNKAAQLQLDRINQQLKEIAGLYKNCSGNFGVSENELWIWYTLIAMSDEYSQQDICSAWSLSKQTVNSIVSNMVKKGYVYLKMVPGSKNRKIICLTEEGREFGEKLVRPLVVAEQNAFARIPLEEQEAIISGVDKYIRYLKEEMDN